MFSVAAGTWPLPLEGDLEMVPAGGVFLVSRGFLTSGPDDPEGGLPPGRWTAGRCIRAGPSLRLKQKRRER